MKRILCLLAIVLCIGAAPLQQTGSRFVAVDILIDPNGQPLAAWQIEFAAETGQVSLVGVETGDHPAYNARPPYYDPAALAGNRVIIGDYSLAGELPRKSFRAARLMLEIRGDAQPQYATKVMAAANPDGKSVPVTVTVK
jgi:hypothetical protein